MFSVTNGPGEYQVAIAPVLFAGLETQAWAIREGEGETQAAPYVPARSRLLPPDRERRSSLECGVSLFGRPKSRATTRRRVTSSRRRR
jgi:hypothetical protein